MDQVKSTDAVLQEVVAGGFIVFAGAAFLWLGRTVIRILGLPKRMSHLEETSSVLLGAQIPLIDAALLSVSDKCHDPDDGEDAKEVKKALREHKQNILDHLTKINRK